MSLHFSKIPEREWSFASVQPPTPSFNFYE